MISIHLVWNFQDLSYVKWFKMESQWPMWTSVLVVLKSLPESHECLKSKTMTSTDNSLKWAHRAKQLKALPGRTQLPSWEPVHGCWRFWPSRGQILLTLVPRPMAEPEATAHAKMLPFWTSWSGSSPLFLFFPFDWPVPCAYWMLAPFHLFPNLRLLPLHKHPVLMFSLGWSTTDDGQCVLST